MTAEDEPTIQRRGPERSVPPQTHRMEHLRSALESPLNTCLFAWTTSATVWIAVCLYTIFQLTSINHSEANTQPFVVYGCVCLFLYGVIMILLSWLGHAAQFKPLNPATSALEPGFVYELFFFLMLIVILVEVFGVVALVSVILDARNNPSVTHAIEGLYAYVFNAIFFKSLIEGTESIDIDSFWAWIDDHCPAIIHKQRCLRYSYFGYSDCAAHSFTCEQSGGGAGFACPYSFCRDAVMRSAGEYLLYVCGAVIWFLSLHLVSAFLSFRIRRELLVKEEREQEFLRWKIAQTALQRRRTACTSSMTSQEDGLLIELPSSSAGTASSSEVSQRHKSWTRLQPALLRDLELGRLVVHDVDLSPSGADHERMRDGHRFLIGFEDSDTAVMPRAFERSYDRDVTMGEQSVAQYQYPIDADESLPPPRYLYSAMALVKEEDGSTHTQYGRFVDRHENVESFV